MLENCDKLVIPKKSFSVKINELLEPFRLNVELIIDEFDDDELEIECDL